MKNGTLYIVPTPIGNLGDMTYRAVEILQKVSVIGAEDTHTSRIMLDHYNLSTKIRSYHKFNERKRVDEFMDILRSGEDIAIISDAGTPGISDPAGIIVQQAIEQDIEVVTLPGATAFLPALISSGLPADRFYFVGFLPEKHAEKRELIQKLEHIQDTLILYEAPHRLKETLEILYKHLGERRTCLAREISKKFETYYRNILSYFIDNFDEVTLKGEFVLVLEGAQEKEYSDEELEALITEKFHQNKSVSRTARELSQELKISKNRVYKLALQMKQTS